MAQFKPAACLYVFLKWCKSFFSFLQLRLHRGSHADLSLMLVECDFGSTLALLTLTELLWILE